MASKALIVAHENEFNKSILGENAYYFKTAEHVEKHVRTIHKNEQKNKVENCYKIISNNYSWQFINQQYLDFFYECLD
jgi:glycosyltransferase involved in cell wall biosynthesis